MRNELLLFLILPLWIASCTYTKVDVARLGPKPYKPTKFPFSLDSLDHLNFEYAHGKTYINTWTGKFQNYNPTYEQWVSVKIAIRPMDKFNILQCLRNLGIDTLRHIKEYYPNRNDHHFYLELYGIKKELHWSIPEPTDNVELRIKELEDVLTEITEIITNAHAPQEQGKMPEEWSEPAYEPETFYRYGHG